MSVALLFAMTVVYLLARHEYIVQRGVYAHGTGADLDRFIADSTGAHFPKGGLPSIDLYPNGMVVAPLLRECGTCGAPVDASRADCRYCKYAYA